MSHRSASLALSALLLASCHRERVAELEGRIAQRREEVRELQQRIGDLKQELDKSPPPTASVRRDNDPPGFSVRDPLPPGRPGQPDILLVSIDTLRFDHLGTYGYSRDTTPFIDELGAAGTVFDQAWSPVSWTLPAHTTMLSGWLPLHHGTIDDHLTIDPKLPLLQEAFQAQGWGTIGAVSTLFVSSRYGFDRGFDRFNDFGVLDKATNNLSTVDADHVFHNALFWAQKSDPGKPLFVFAHLYDCHYQYDPPAPWNEKFDRPPQWSDEVYRNYEYYKKKMISKVQMDHQIAQYDEELAFVDAQIREFVEAWRASGRELIVMITADHGEEFGERGSWGHGHTLYHEQLHVPLVVSGPGVAVQRVQERIGTEDLAPTLAELAGISFDTARDGRSRATQLREGSVPDQIASARFGETSRFETLVYKWNDGPFDLIVDLNERKRELFDLSSDPDGLRNVYKPNHDKAEQMFRDMSEWLGQPWTSAASGSVVVKQGALFQDGVRAESDSLPVKPGSRFAVEPGDAFVEFHPASGAMVGPWRPLGGSVPGAGCPVKFDGRFLEGAEISEKSEEEIAMLEALGYVQGNEEGEETPAMPEGRVPCR